MILIRSDFLCSFRKTLDFLCIMSRLSRLFCKAAFP